MKGGTIPDDVRRFILSDIPSVPYLEALLLLRDAPARSWDAAQLAQRLYLSEKTAAEILAQLQAHELAASSASSGACHYQPAQAAQADMVDRLAQAYAGNLIGVSTLIHSHGGPAERKSDEVRARTGMRTRKS